MTKHQTILFIRHGKTAGNREKRYIGRTDEPLCEAGIKELREMDYPPVDLIVCSPLRRCLQTAAILYPGQSVVTHAGLRECDFGDFEGRNCRELNGNPAYQQWIDSGGLLPFPNGEAHGDFLSRCGAAFSEISMKYRQDFATAAFIIHGGSIMAILEQFALPRRNFYEYQIDNGHGFVTEYDGETLTVLSRF